MMLQHICRILLDKPYLGSSKPSVCNIFPCKKCVEVETLLICLTDGSLRLGSITTDCFTKPTLEWIAFFIVLQQIYTTSIRLTLPRIFKTISLWHFSLQKMRWCGNSALLLKVLARLKIVQNNHFMTLLWGFLPKVHIIIWSRSDVLQKKRRQKWIWGTKLSIEE